MERQPDRSCKRPLGRSPEATAQPLRRPRARQADNRVRAGRWARERNAERAKVSILLERASFSFEDERAGRIRSEEQAQALREQLEESRQQLERSRSETEAERRARIRLEGELWDIKDRLRESRDYFKRRALFP